MLYFRRGRFGLGLFRVSLGLIRVSLGLVKVRARVFSFSLAKTREFKKIKFSIEKN